MKIKRSLHGILLVLLLSACSLAPKSESDELAPPESSKDFSDLSAPAAEPAKAQTHEGVPTDKTVAPSSTPEWQALSEAIKANNEDGIYRASIAMLAKYPSDLRALNALGMYHYRRGHLSASELMFGKALKINPNSSELHNNMALVYLAQKEQRDAIKEFRKALELNPGDPIAAANIGSIYVAEKEYAKALVALEIAYRKNNKDSKLLNNYAIALTASGKFSNAQEIYKQAIKLNESNKEAMLNYCILLIDQMKQNQEGLDLLYRLKFLGPSPEARNRINVLENKAKAGLK